MTLRSILGALFLAASMFLGADPARAQVCGSLDVAEDVTDAIFGFADDFGPLDPQTCAKVAKGGLSACHKLVAQVVSCTINRSAAVFRVGNVACRANGDPAACVAQHRAQLEQIVNVTETVEAQQHALCEDFADDFFADCLAGF
jgi:hypothetical protein